MGRWPLAASIDYFNDNHGGQLPPGILRTVTPAAADGWLTALKQYGTMTAMIIIEVVDARSLRPAAQPEKKWVSSMTRLSQEVMPRLSDLS